MKPAIRSRRVGVTTFGVADTETYHIRCMARDGIDVRIVEDGLGKGKPRIWKNGVDIPIYTWENGVDEAIVLHRFVGGEPTDETPKTWIRQYALATGGCQGDTVTQEKTCKTLEEFFRMIVDSGVRRVYFHNLKFDIEMIWNEFYSKAVERSIGMILKIDDGLRIVAEKHCVRLVKGQCYSVKMFVEKPKIIDGQRRGWKRDGNIEFRDSMKIWRKGVGQLAIDLGLAGKGSTTGGSQALRTTDDELLAEYCLQDCRIIVRAMQMYFKLVHECGGPVDGYITAGSTAWELGKIWLEDSLRDSDKFEGKTPGEIQTAINTLFPSNIDAIDNYDVVVENGRRVEEIVDGVRQVKCVYKPIVKTFPKRNPDGSLVKDENGKVVMEETINKSGKSKYGNFFRNGYKGAIPLLNRRKTLRESYIAKTVRSLDINSAYPDVICNYPLPVGKPIEYLKGDDVKTLFEMGYVPKGYTYYLSVNVDMRVKPGKRATFIDKTGLGVNDDGDRGKLVDNFKGTIYVCQPEWEMICNDYDFKSPPVVKKVVYFKTMVGVFKGFIMRFYNMKSVSTGAKREFCKLIINSFYGKFGTNPFTEEECWIPVDGIAKKQYVKGGTDIKSEFYLPMAIWTTAYVRQKISRACNAIGWDSVVYTDTDSLKVENMSIEECVRRLESVGYKIDSKELGAFKDEGVHDKIAFIRNKGYVCLNTDESISVDKRGNKEITMGGVNKFQGLNTLNDLINGNGYQNRHFSVIGGALIMSKKIELNDMNQFTEKKIYTIKEISVYDN